MSKVRAIAISMAMLTFGLGELSASAKPKVGKGAVFVSTKSFPSKASSESALRALAKKTSTKTIMAVDPQATKEWAFEFNIMVFFGRVLDDSQIIIKVYDVTDGTLRMVANFEQYLQGKGSASYKSTVRLKHPDLDVRPKREYLIKLSSKSGNIGEATFRTDGKVPVNSGNVVFEEGEGN